MRVGMLTGGGDCPGLNAVIRAATHRLVDNDAEPVGVLRGWRGLIDGLFRAARPRGRLGHPAARRHDPATRAARTRSAWRAASTQCRKAFEHLDGLMASAATAPRDPAPAAGGQRLPFIGVPKTIDNDVFNTERAIGFARPSPSPPKRSTGCSRPPSHERVMVLEVMGRDAGPPRHALPASRAAPTSC